MGSTKHERSFVDYDKPYEQNLIGLKGIVYFGIGLFLLIVITFSLIHLLINVLEANLPADIREASQRVKTDKDRLPPEPRLQSAPGFGVSSDKGWVNLELREPQAEYKELHKQWESVWKDGKVDAASGATTVIPIEKAKEIVLASGLKTRPGDEAGKAGNQSNMIISDSSAGRIASEKRR